MTTDAPERLWLWGKDDGSWLLIDRGCLAPDTATQYVRADLPRPQDAARIAELEAENARLRAGLALLDKAAADTIRYGAQTGPQWSRLTIASLKARAALAADSGAARVKEGRDE